MNRALARARDLFVVAALFGTFAAPLPVHARTAGDGALEPSALSKFETAPDEPRALLRAGRYADAESRARAALRDAEAKDGADGLDAARAMDLLVAALVGAGKARLPETAELARRAVAIKERVVDPDGHELAASLYGLAEQLRMAGAYADAGPLYERALALRERSPERVEDLIESLRGLATFRYKCGEYATARALYDRALSLAEHSDGEEQDVALLLVDRARLLRTVGDYMGGRPLLDRALEIQERALGPDHLDVAYTLRELGELIRISGDYATARPVFERALRIREKILGPDHLEVADVLTGQGILLRRVGVSRDNTCPEAIPVCRRALNIAERTLGPANPDLAVYLEGMAWAVLQCTGPVGIGGDRYESRALFARSLAILEAAFGPNHVALADTLEGHAVTDTALGEGLGWYRRKLEIERAAFGRDSFPAAFTLMRMAQYEALPLVQSRPPGVPVEEIIDQALESERIESDLSRRTLRTLADREAVQFAISGRWWGGVDLAISLCVRGADEGARRRSLDALIRSRAMSLDVIGSRHRAAMQADQQALAPLIERVEAARSDLAGIAVRGGAGRGHAVEREVLDVARKRKEQAERELAAGSSVFAAELERDNVGFEQVAAHLPPSTALVSYRYTYRYPWADPLHTYVVFVLRAGDRAPSVVDLGGFEEIDRLILDWRRLVAKPSDDGKAEAASRAAGVRLRKAIWDPVAKQLKGVERVFIVPDRLLNTVSFAALPTGTGSYLVERGPILHYLSAERDLVPSPHHVTGGGLLALGGPSFEETPIHLARAVGPSASAAQGFGYRGTRSVCGSFRSLRFTSLPESGAEVRSVVEIWKDAEDVGGADAVRGSAVALVGASASEAAFKSRAPNQRILHLATHGFFLGGACDASHDASARSVVAENPLLHAGLALAGANRRDAAGPNEEDGILTAEEIASLDLSSVEWAVLSACDTAAGERSGEGILGLQRAFRIAGARTLVMSLWPVDDRITRRWMQRLYTLRLRDKLDTAAAVRGAMLSALNERRRKGLGTDPFYWAGFIASGDWR